MSTINNKEVLLTSYGILVVLCGGLYLCGVNIRVTAGIYLILISLLTLNVFYGHIKRYNGIEDIPESQNIN